MWFDRLRYLYTTRARVIRGSDEEIEIRWKWAPPGAKPFPGSHIFGSQIFQDYPKRDLGGLGEVYGTLRHAKSITSPYAGQRVEGDPEWYRLGLPPEVLAGLPPSAPGGCGPAARGGLVWGAAGIQGVPGVQRGAAGLALGAHGDQSSGPEEAGRAGLLLGAAGGQRAGLVQPGAAGVLLGGETGLQTGLGGLLLGAAGGQRAGLVQPGAAGLLLGALGVQTAGVRQAGAAGILWGCEGRPHVGVYTSVYRNTSQSFTSGVPAAVVFNTADYDPLGQWSPTVNPSRVTVANSGLYLVEVQGSISAGGNINVAGINVNGVGVATWRYDIVSVGQLDMTLSTLLRLNTGDYIELVLYATHGFTTIAAAGEYPALKAYRIDNKDP